jgi:hypothetical protein
MLFDDRRSGNLQPVCSKTACSRTRWAIGEGVHWMALHLRRHALPGSRRLSALVAFAGLLVGLLTPALAAQPCNQRHLGRTMSFRFSTYGSYTPPQALSTGYNFVFLPGSTVATDFAVAHQALEQDAMHAAAPELNRMALQNTSSKYYGMTGGLAVGQAAK